MYEYMKRSCKIARLSFTPSSSVIIVLLYRFRVATIHVWYIAKSRAPLFLEKPRDCNERSTKTPPAQKRDVLAIRLVTVE
jgi:hypothetical protein